MPLASGKVARAGLTSVNGGHVGPADLAPCNGGAVEEQAIEHGAGIDDDRMGHVQPRAVVIAADELDGADDFFRKRIIEQEGIRLDGLVREAAAARFFPGEMLVYDGDAMPGASKLSPAHGSGRTTADDSNFRHCENLAAECLICSRARNRSGPGKDEQGTTRREYSTVPEKTCKIDRPGHGSENRAPGAGRATDCAWYHEFFS